MRITKKMPSLSNVSAGSTATLDIPVGRTIDRIAFAYSGITLPQMKNLKVMVNGKTIQEYPNGEYLQKINAYYGLTDTAGFLTINFVRPEMANIPQRRLTGLGTVDIDSFQVSFDIDSAATAPVISATAIQSEPTNIGSILKIKRFPMASSVSGLLEIDKIVKGNAIRAIHIVDIDAAADTKPTSLEVEMDSVKVFEASATLAAEMQKQHGRTPQSDIYHCDFTLEGDFGQALLTQKAQDFRIRPTLANAGAIDVVVEYLDGLNGI